MIGHLPGFFRRVVKFARALNVTQLKIFKWRKIHFIKSRQGHLEAGMSL